MSGFFGRRKAPVITVALPLYRCKHIGWLALESLARQKGVDFAWELIVAEERRGGMREKNIRAYEKVLRRAGCVQIRYIGLRDWIPLSRKWQLIGQDAHPASRGFVLQSGDSYSPPQRLRCTADLFKDPNTDWVQSRQGILYDLSSGRTLRFEATMEGYRHPCACFMAFRSEYARNLPKADVERGVDYWLFTEVGKIKGAPVRVTEAKDLERGGVETHGANSISNRSPCFARPSVPFRADDEQLFEALPADIRNRLRAFAIGKLSTEEERIERMESNLARYRASKEAPNPSTESP